MNANEQKIEIGDVITWNATHADYGVVTRISENDYGPGTYYWCEKWYRDKGCARLQYDGPESYLRESSAILVRKGSRNISVACQQISAYDQPTDFKVGDKVYCLMYGPGVVEDINLPGNYEVSVKFENDAGNCAYTKDGTWLVEVGRDPFLSPIEVDGEIVEHNNSLVNRQRKSPYILLGHKGLRCVFHTRFMLYSSFTWFDVYTKQYDILSVYL